MSQHQRISTGSPSADRHNLDEYQQCPIMYVGSTPHDSDSESDSASGRCAGCGRRFVPAGRQRYCSRDCYSETLRVPIEDRFWSKVNKCSRHQVPGIEGACWLWTAGTIRGYGQIASVVNGKRRPVYTHRVAWELTHGRIKDGLSVLHRCDVPLCCNPSHLFLGTLQDNLNDARAKGRLDESLPRTRTLTYADRLAIYSAKGYRGVCVSLAHEYGVSKTCISLIRKGRFARPKDMFERVACVQLPVRGHLHVGTLAAESDSRQSIHLIGATS